MHTLHWIAIEADSKEEAESSVVSILEQSKNNWWDWFDTDIGGRWKENAQTVCAKDSDKYKETIDLIIGNRKSEVTDSMGLVSLDKVVGLIEDYEGDGAEFDDSMHLWRLKNISKLICDEYYSASYFYDIEDWTPSLKYLRERVNTNPSNQYLVPIDFHY